VPPQASLEAAHGALTVVGALISAPLYEEAEILHALSIQAPEFLDATKPPLSSYLQEYIIGRRGCGGDKAGQLQ
jgi:hypothetical protein